MDEERKFALKMAVKRDDGKGNTDICALANKFLEFLRVEKMVAAKAREATMTAEEIKVCDIVIDWLISAEGSAKVVDVFDTLHKNGVYRDTTAVSRQRFAKAIGKSRRLQMSSINGVGTINLID